MIEIFNQFGDSSSGLSALGINGSAFLIQLGTFILAFLVLRQWAFKPVVRLLQERREIIEKGVNLGEQMKKEQAELETRVTKELHEARAKADGIIAGAETESKRIVQEAEDKASAKADSLVASAQDRIIQDTLRARKQLEAEVVDLISDATEAIIDEKIDPKKDSALIDKALEKGRGR
ncbi:MAG TPA: F0F1 ATP synthase subunit B [Candidatus Binatia bacterium]|nr:F0F1 ATP synthase subunit B [Candidatus Binatia bacterium]